MALEVPAKHSLYELKSNKFNIMELIGKGIFSSPFHWNQIQQRNSNLTPTIVRKTVFFKRLKKAFTEH